MILATLNLYVVFFKPQAKYVPFVRQN